MDIGIASIISSSIIGTAGIIISVVYGYVPAKRRAREEQLRKELLRVYKNVKCLLDIEMDLTNQLSLNKQVVRKKHQLTKDVQPKRLERRIRELEVLLKQD